MAQEQIAEILQQGLQDEMNSALQWQESMEILPSKKNFCLMPGKNCGMRRNCCP